MPVDTADYVVPGRARLSKSPWIFLFSISLDLRYRLRVAYGNAQVTWPTTGGQLYYPCDLDFGPFSETLDMGSGGKFKIKTSNANMEMSELFEYYRGFLDKWCRVYLVHSTKLNVATPRKRWLFRVADVRQVGTALEWTLGELVDFTRPEPHEYYDADFCRFGYGGQRCLFDRNRPGAPQTCTRIYWGNNGCVAHGEWERDNGYKQTMPGRCGCFSTIAVEGN